MKQQSDKDLISAIANGDKLAMRELYDRHAAGLTRFVGIKLKDPSDAPDIVHEAMLVVWKTAGRYSGAAKVKTWIYSIARNKAIDQNRKGKRLVQHEPDFDINDESPDPEAITMAFQNAERVRDCIDQLGETHKTAIHLAFYEDLTYAEVSQVLERPVGTIKTRIMHAKKLLMHCLSS